ncbi:GntR family transcriptional regulator [Micromonospora haikouensis]|uniref:GntR family transcriptional regulator n=1 Tax=Micromonospora haikouensis TaxID=686309 RepID=UPI00367F15AC
MIRPGTGRALYHQLADLLRDEITSGRIKPGTLLPYEGRLAQEHDISLPTVRRAIQVLRTEGLVVTERGYGTRVVEQQQRQRIRVPRGARILIRMPTDAERAELGVEPGMVVPVVEIRVGAQLRGPWRADLVELSTA